LLHIINAQINAHKHNHTNTYIPELHYSDNLAVHLIDQTIHHRYKLLVLDISLNDFHTPPQDVQCWDDPVCVPCVCVCVCGERKGKICDDYYLRDGVKVNVVRPFVQPSPPHAHINNQSKRQDKNTTWIKYYQSHMTHQLTHDINLLLQLS
jgi:hypothetical protein